MRQFPLPVAIEQIDKSLHHLRIIPSIRRQRFSRQISLGYFANPKVRIAEQVEQPGNHGLGSRQLIGGLGPIPLPISDLSQLCQRQLVVRIKLEFRLQVVFSFVQVAIPKGDESFIGMSTFDPWIDFLCPL